MQEEKQEQQEKKEKKEKVVKPPDMDTLDQGGEKAKNMSFRKSVRYLLKSYFIIFYNILIFYYLILIIVDTNNLRSPQ